MKKRVKAKSEQTILEQAALVGMMVGGFFWGFIFFVNIDPAHPIEFVFVLFLSFAYGVMIPLLVNLLIPFTPASQLLQETRWRTIGFAVSAAIGVLMLIHAGSVVYSYLLTKPVVVANGLEVGLSFGFIVVFVLFPALSINQISPERWVAEIRIAAEVKRYRESSKAQLAAVAAEHAVYMSTIRRISVNGLSSVTREEAEFVRDHLHRLHAQENESIEQILWLLHDILGRESGVSILQDDQIAEVLDERVFKPLYQLTDFARGRTEKKNE